MIREINELLGFEIEEAAMGYPEYHCVACKEEHGAAFWYYRDRNGRREYLYGEKYNKLSAQSGWTALGSS